MPIAFWASAAAVALAACGAPAVVTPASPASPPAAADPETTARSQVEVRIASGVNVKLDLDLDESVAVGANVKDVKVIGETDKAVVLMDTYASLPGGMSYCQAGEESFLRVVSLSSSEPYETLRIKAASCRQNIELASPGVEWDASRSILRVQWLSGPASPAIPATLTLQLGAQ
jgi:hypothetical protein